nr:hypothetical protein [Tanacetum cinerariifolium]
MNTSVLLLHLIEMRDRMKKIRLDHLKQDQEMQEIPTATGGDPGSPRNITGPPGEEYERELLEIGEEGVVLVGGEEGGEGGRP